MSFEDIKKLDDAYVMHTYGRYNLAIDHGKGAICYDPAGKSYIDFTSGIGVSCLGYGNEGWADSIAAQAKKRHEKGILRQQRRRGKRRRD